MHALVPLLAAALVGQAGPSKKVDIVSVTGCLRQSTPNADRGRDPGGIWTLEAATDPVVSIANAPPAKDIPATPPIGTNTFRLIGVSEFNLAAHKGHTVIVKGLFIKAEPISRVNITSVTMVAPTCASK